jgi:hypothetical protein
MAYHSSRLLLLEKMPVCAFKSLRACMTGVSAYAGRDGSVWKKLGVRRVGCSFMTDSGLIIRRNAYVLED